jgi:hypothetical protein
MIEQSSRKRGRGAGRRPFNVATSLTADQLAGLERFRKLMGMSRAAALRYLVARQNAFAGATVQRTA